MTFGSILVIESYVTLSSKNISLVGPLYPLDQLLIILQSMQDSDLNKRITLLLTTTCTEVNPTMKCCLGKICNRQKVKCKMKLVRKMEGEKMVVTKVVVGGGVWL